MDGDVIIAIRYKEWFAWNEQQNWEYCKRMNKAKPIIKKKKE